MRPFLLLLLIPFTSLAANQLPVSFDGYLDVYYAYDFNHYLPRQREFTTQPARHNEFNVNLAHIGATYERERTRGRLALHHGTAVTSNASHEAIENRFIQEAYVGKKVGDRSWVDLGVFFGHIGAESWISKDNWNYTRGLLSEYTPYYASGVRLMHELDQRQSIQLQILNGWQNMTENNHGKAIGFQYKREISQRMTFTYNNFHGDEEVVSERSRFRGYHDFIFTLHSLSGLQYLWVLDFGHQAQQQNNGIDAWYGTQVGIRKELNEERALAARLEYYHDRHEANLVTDTPHGFDVLGLTLTHDQQVDANAIWRTELRGFYSKDKIYQETATSKDRWDGFLVTSLALWF